MIETMPVIEQVPGTTQLPEPAHGSGEGRNHWARYPFKHAICGVTIIGPERSGVSDCEHCIRIMRLWADHGVWEGFGKRHPGRDATEEIRWELNL